MKDGATFPPISVVYDGLHSRINDRHHRVEAYRPNGVPAVLADVLQIKWTGDFTHEEVEG